MILVTGGAGFIGANFVLDWFARPHAAQGEPVVTLDLLTYAGNLANLDALRDEPRHHFVRGDICDGELVADLLREHRPRAIVHFAAESHVDRSIHGPADFVRTNVQGTFTLLEAARGHWEALKTTAPDEAARFRFLHVSTDEVYGSLGQTDPAFTETTAYQPNSPYSASKAASDHLARAWHHTYGLPVVTSNCSNNYGPFQFPEKLIPLIIANALAGRPLPIYGDGQNVRDWLFVGDHCAALRAILDAGRPGETYNVGGDNELSNLAIVQLVCRLLDERSPATAAQAGGTHEKLIRFVTDRPGHDRRYAIDARKILHELAWQPAETLESGLRTTVDWYLDHQEWVANVQSGTYRDWIDLQYKERGLG